MVAPGAVYTGELKSSADCTGTSLTEMITLLGAIPAISAGEPSTTPRSRAPSTPGPNDDIITPEKSPSTIIAITMLLAGPAANTFDLLLRVVFFNASSSGSTNAPTGNTRNTSQSVRTLMSPTRVNIPWANSCTMIAITRPRMPYPTGITGLIQGMPGMCSGEGAGATCVTIVASHKRSVMMIAI